MNIMNLKIKELCFSEIILFHRCPTILNGLVLELVIVALRGKCDSLADDVFFKFCIKHKIS